MLNRLVAAALLFVAISACGSVAPRVSPVPPDYIGAADNFRNFESADQLAHYLRLSTGCSPLISAHRGGPVSAFPENALQTFGRSLRHGPVLLEVDVRRTADGVLILMHDETLDRTTTGNGLVSETTFKEVRDLFLVDANGIVTPFQVPTLRETLAWAEGRAILTLDIKRGVSPDEVIEMVRLLEAEPFTVIIVYTLESLREYSGLAPDLVYSVPADSPDLVNGLEDYGGNIDRSVFWTGVGIPDPDAVVLIHERDGLAMAGTFGEIDETARIEGPSVYNRLLDAGVDVIATDEVALVSRAISLQNREDCTIAK